MAFGIQTWKADGTTVVLSPSVIGGVFLGPYAAEAGVTTTVTFPDWPNRTVRAIQSGPGGHNWVESVVGGIPQITFTAINSPASAPPFAVAQRTTLQVFIV